MALSNTERQRRYRERRRRAKAEPPAQPAPLPLRRAFAEFIHSDKYRVEAFDTALKKLDVARLGEWEHWIEAGNALETCRHLVGDTYDGAIMAIAAICELVNEYKIEQIDARLREIENAVPDNPSLKEAADKFAAHLRNVRAQYQRRNRYAFMPMEVEGE
jgi:hypothetical protein